jgi:hypothetical protein
VPLGIKFNCSPIFTTLNQEQNVLFGVVINKDPPGCMKQKKHFCTFFHFLISRTMIYGNINAKIYK